ncbi:DNA polymerase III subunit beta [Solibacillus silvestris]
MEIIIKNTVLKDIIKKVQAVMKGKVTLPILSGLLFEAVNGKLQITGSNGYETIGQLVEGVEIVEDGKVVIPFTFLRSASQINGEINFKQDGPKILINKGRTKLESTVMSADEYPSFPNEAPAYQLRYTGGDWKEMITSVTYAAATSESRPSLRGVNIQVTQEGQSFVCTDSHRLARVKYPKAEVSEELSIVLPADSLKNTTGIFDEQKPVVVIGFKNRVAMLNSNVIYTVSAIEGNYPDTGRLIPETFEHEIEVNKPELEGAIKLLSSLSEKKIVAAKFTSEGINFSINEEISNGEVIVNASVSEELTVGFNMDYLKEAIQPFEKDTLLIKVNGSLKPVVITEKDNEQDKLALVLPIRLMN